jgi:hypothetical protein
VVYPIYLTEASFGCTSKRVLKTCFGGVAIVAPYE